MLAFRWSAVRKLRGLITGEGIYIAKL